MPTGQTSVFTGKKSPSGLIMQAVQKLYTSTQGTDFSMYFINGEDTRCEVENIDCKVAG